MGTLFIKLLNFIINLKSFVTYIKFYINLVLL